MPARATPAPRARTESDLLVALAPHVEDFLATLFGIEAEARALAERHNELAPLYSVKRLFVQRRALHKVKPEDAKPDGFDFTTELDFARQVTDVAEGRSRERAKSSKRAARYAAWATLTPEGKEKHRRGVLFKAPRKLDYMKLIPHTELRQREGFALTDPGTDLVGALDEANYCIWCHEQGKDSCSKGLKEKAPAEGFRKTVFGVPLAGCPLEEKISEFHMVKARGEPLAALGIIAVDNPMVGGHRPPHLQRLHEVLHLPEAGPGRHPAGRDAHAEGRARAAVGLRDLLAAHALEPVRPAPALSRGRLPERESWSSASGRPASPSRTT